MRCLVAISCILIVLAAMVVVHNALEFIRASKSGSGTELRLWHGVDAVIRSINGPYYDQAACKTRLRRRSNFARPYICRLIVLRRFTWPSVCPLLISKLNPATTAAQS